MHLLHKKDELTAHQAAVYALSYNGHRNELYSGGSEKNLIFWDLEKEVITYVLKDFSGALLSICNQGNILAVGDFTGHLYLFDVVKKEYLKHWKVCPTPIFDLHFYSDSELLVLNGSGEIILWDIHKGVVQNKIMITDSKLRNIQVFKNDLYLISAGDGCIYWFHPGTFTIKEKLKAHNGSVYQALVSGSSVISSGQDGHIKVWDAASLQNLRSIPAHYSAVYALQPDHNNLYLASASRDKTIKLWDLRQMEFLQKLSAEEAEGHSRSVNRLLWIKPENQLISAGDDGKIMIWKF